MNYFFDTNVILKLQGKIFDYEGELWISSVTLQELESIKTSRNKDADVKAAARHVAKMIDEDDYRILICVYSSKEEETLVNMGLEATPDNKICACAYSINNFYNSRHDEMTFISDDICCKLSAQRVFHIPSQSTENITNIYKGYKEITGNVNDLNNYMANINYKDWCINEYLIMENTEDGSVKEMRFDGEKFVALRLPSSKYIKAKNSLQRCALDILYNPSITVAAILGGYGSGKTYLSMRMGLYHIKEKGFQSKLLGLREPHGEGKEIGYLPGEFESKTEYFFAPLADQLAGGEYELISLRQQGVLEESIPYFLKGRTYNDTIIVVDEAEDLSLKQLRLIGTRLGENSKIYLAGDYKQSLVDTSEHNGLIKLCESFKNDPRFGCIYLGEDVRSETSKMFADLSE